MHQIAPTGGLPDDVFDSMQALARLGYHVFPAAHRSKTPWPGLPWKVFDESPLGDDLIDKFRGLPKTPNIALICNEHLVVIDIDNLTFGAWFEAQGPERLGTWIVQTPSGGLHVYCHSAEPISTTVLKTRGGVKVGDLKARGGYVICPPSVGSNGEYETAYGAPNQLVRVDDAKAWFSGFIAAYESTLPVRIDHVSRAGDEYADVRTQDVPPAEDQQALWGLLHAARLANQVSEYVYVTLTEGSDHPLAVDHWKDPDDHSGIDFGCVKELINLGWTFPQVEQWYAFAPVGEPRYRGKDKSRGHGYLLRTYDAARARWDADQVNLKNARFANFQVVEPVERFMLEKELFYSFKLETTDRQHNIAYDVTCRGWDFAIPQRFRDACYRAGVFIDLGNFDTKEKLRTFVEILDNLAVDRALPEAATQEGVTRATLRSYVLMNASVTGTILDARVWTEGDWVYLRPLILQRFLLAMTGGRYKPQDTWAAWCSLSGTESTWQGEAVWKAPLRMFPGIVS